LDVQIAHGSTGGGSSSTKSSLGKRRQRSEEDDDSHKRRRHNDDDYENRRSGSSSSGGGDNRNRRRDRTSQNIIDVPIFITHNALNNYTYHVQELLENPQQPTQFTIKCHLINLTRDTDSYLKSPQFLTRIAEDRFVIVIQRRNEAEQTVAFRAILPDGSSPGFADTPVADVISFILQNAATSLATSTPTTTPPPSNIQQQYQPQPVAQYPPTSMIPPTTGYVDPQQRYQYPPSDPSSAQLGHPTPLLHQPQITSYPATSSMYDPTTVVGQQAAQGSSNVIAAAMAALTSGTVSESEKALLEQIVSSLKTSSTTAATTVPTNPTNYYDPYGTTTGYVPQDNRANNNYSPSLGHVPAQSFATTQSSTTGQYNQDYNSGQPYRYDSTSPLSSSSSAGSVPTNSSSIGSLLNSLQNIIKK
jgi:hypothetical protein